MGNFMGQNFVIWAALACKLAIFVEIEFKNWDIWAKLCIFPRFLGESVDC